MNTVSVIESKLQELFPEAYVVVVAPGWPYGCYADVFSQNGGELPDVDHSLLTAAFGDGVGVLVMGRSSGVAIRIEASVKS